MSPSSKAVSHRTIFPNEIWYMIISNIPGNSNTSHNLIKAMPSLKPLISSWKLWPDEVWKRILINAPDLRTLLHIIQAFPLLRPLFVQAHRSIIAGFYSNLEFSMLARVPEAMWPKRHVLDAAWPEMLDLHQDLCFNALKIWRPGQDWKKTGNGWTLVYDTLPSSTAGVEAQRLSVSS